jgi:hypothetical protein
MHHQLLRALAAEQAAERSTRRCEPTPAPGRAARAMPRVSAARSTRSRPLAVAGTRVVSASRWEAPASRHHLNYRR